MDVESAEYVVSKIVEQNRPVRSLRLAAAADEDRYETELNVRAGSAPDAQEWTDALSGLFPGTEIGARLPNGDCRSAGAIRSDVRSAWREKIDAAVAAGRELGPVRDCAYVSPHVKVTVDAEGQASVSFTPELPDGTTRVRFLGGWAFVGYTSADGALSKVFLLNRCVRRPGSTEGWKAKVSGRFKVETVKETPVKALKSAGGLIEVAKAKLLKIELVTGKKITADMIFGKIREVNWKDLKLRPMGSPDRIPPPFENMVVGFVDEAPGAGWSHPCDYVIFNADSPDLSEYVILRMDVPPWSVDQREPVCEPGAPVYGDCLREQTVEMIKSAVEQLKKAKQLNAANGLEPEVSGDPSKSHFLVIAGGANPQNNGLRFWADAAMYYSTLRYKYGVPKENIKLLVSDGGSPDLDAIAFVSDGGTNYQTFVSSPADLDGDGKNDVTGPANLESVQAALEEFEDTLTPADQLTVFISSHGSPIGEASASNHDCAAWLFDMDPAKQEVLRDWQLELMTKEICCPVGFAIETCFSGGFIDNVTNVANRVIATACRHDQFSFGNEGAIPFVNLGTFDGAISSFNTWALPFTGAVRGAVPDSVLTENRHPWDDNEDSRELCREADMNKDGRVSFGEAFAFSAKYDSCANPEKEPYEEPQFAESAAGFGERFFTLKQAEDVAGFIRTSKGDYVVRLQLPEGETLTPQKVAAIEGRDGVQVIGFLPPRGLLVRVRNPNRMDAGWKMEGERCVSVPEFEGNLETVAVDVFPWSADLIGAVGAKIGEMGGEVISSFTARALGSWSRIRAKLPRGKVAELAADGDVRRIRKPLKLSKIEFQNNVSRQAMNMNAEATYPAEPVGDTLGLTGKGQIVGHADTGLDANSFDDPEHPMHPDFTTNNVLKIIMLSHSTAQDVAGHGTHTLGSIVGSGVSSNGLYRGIAYGARAVTQVLGTECANGTDGDGNDDPPWELADIYQQTYDLGARVHSDSWGWESTYSYEEPCAKADLYVFEHPEMLVVVSAGNSFDKDPGGYGSIVEPAAGKNILAVGAYGNYGDNRTYHNHVISNDYYVYTGEMADFSSRGPASTNDVLRIKPDVSAPGIYVTSTHSRYDLDEDKKKPYTCFSGTSMSSPLTAGAALLMREYLAKYEGMDRPSSALLRAAFIGGAKPVKTYEDGTYYAVPSVECGWGGVDVGGTLAPTNAMTLFVDHVETNLVDGAEWMTTLNVTNSAVPLRIALAWTDYPAESPDVPALVNDYDLVVTDPYGRRVWSNGLDREDRANPQETVFVDTPVTGKWTVSVRAYQVFVDGSVLGLYCRGAFAPAGEDETQQRNDLMKSVKPGLRSGMGRNLDEVAAFDGESEEVRDWLEANGIAAADFAADNSGAASFLLGLKKLLSGDAQAQITAFEKDGDVLRVTFELRREGEAIDLSGANTDYVKAIVRCAEDLGFETEIEAEKPVAAQTGAAWTVEIKPPTDKSAAFVRIEIK